MAKTGSGLTIGCCLVGGESCTARTLRVGDSATHTTDMGMPAVQMNSVGRSPSRSPSAPAARADTGISAAIANRKLAFTRPCSEAGEATWRMVAIAMFMPTMAYPATKYTAMNTAVLAAAGPGTSGMAKMASAATAYAATTEGP